MTKEKREIINDCLKGGISLEEMDKHYKDTCEKHQQEKRSKTEEKDESSEIAKKMRLMKKKIMKLF